MSTSTTSGPTSATTPKGGLTVLGLADHGEPAGFVEDPPGAGAEQFVVVDDHHPQRWLSRTGVRGIASDGAG